MDVVVYAILGAIAIVIAKNPRLRTRIVKSGGGSNPLILIGVGLVLFNLVAWAMLPWFWELLMYKNYTLVLFNLGFGGVLHLRTIKIKGDDGKPTKETDPTASKLAMIIGALLILGLTTTAYFIWRNGDLTPKEYQAKADEAKEIRKAWAEVPADMLVLTVVAKCQPSEFDSPKKIQSAVDFYEKSGLLYWRNSMSCWESQIERKMLPFTFAIVETTPEWGEKIRSPKITGAAKIDIADAPEDCVALANGGGEEKSCNKATWGAVRYFTQVRSTGTKPGKVKFIIR